MNLLSAVSFSSDPPEAWIGWLILSLIAGVITILFEFTSHQMRTQRGYLMLTSIANVFWALMFVFEGLRIGNLGSTLIMILAAVFGVVRGLAFWWVFAKKTKQRKIIGRVVLYISMAIVAGAAIFAVIGLDTTTQRIIQSIGIVTGLLFVLGQYLPSKHWLRLFVVMYATMIAIGSTPLSLLGDPIPTYGFNNYGYYVFTGNYKPGEGYWSPMSIAIEASKVASITLFYIILAITTHIKKKRERLGRAAPPPIKLPLWLEKVLNFIQGSAKEKAYATSINQKDAFDANETIQDIPLDEEQSLKRPPIFRERTAEIFREIMLDKNGQPCELQSTENSENEDRDEEHSSGIVIDSVAVSDENGTE
ncbi:MAG: hypothetical protein FWE22_03105 [Firmicutes bacterium]|nr:hypothetical protein [Bacillota bacterium]